MAERKAALIIDLQNDYLWEKRKSIFAYDTEKLINNVNSAIHAYKDQGYDIIYIKHILSKLMWGVGYSIKGTEGAELYGGLSVVSDLCFEKSKPDAYTSKPFQKHMENAGYREVVLMGLDECGCVGATAKGAIKTGIKVKALKECIASRFPEAKVTEMRNDLTQAGVEYI